MLAAELKAVFLAFASFGSGQVSIDVAAIAHVRPTTTALHRSNHEKSQIVKLRSLLDVVC
jgi:hypothetical protein